MQFLGGKLSAAQLQVAGWVSSVRRSLQGALELVWGNTEEKQNEGDGDKEEEEESGNGGGRLQRAMSPLRSFARRSRRSLRHFSNRSRQTLERRTTESCSAQVNSYCINREDKDTDALIDSDSDQQNDSPKPIPDLVPEVSLQDDDTNDFHREQAFAPFPESPTPLLDTSAQRSKAVLSRRRSRTRPSRSMRLAQTKSPNWRIHDSADETEISSKHRDSDSEEEQPKSKIVCSPPPTSQRVPTIPGLSPAALIAQLKMRTVGGGAATEEEKENLHEEVVQSPSQLPRSPRPAAHLAGAALVLPPLGSQDRGTASSPAWLKELKSKKRLSQCDSEA